MTLYDVLASLNLDTMVAINNIERPSKHGFRYQKLRNIKWENLRHDLKLDVLNMEVNEHGLFISIYNDEDLERNINNSELVNKYFIFKEQRENGNLLSHKKETENESNSKGNIVS